MERPKEVTLSWRLYQLATLRNKSQRIHNPKKTQQPYTGFFYYPQLLFVYRQYKDEFDLLEMRQLKNSKIYFNFF